MRTEESRTDLGNIKIHRNVVASIASIAAGEIPGVKSVGRNLRANLMELVGQKSFSSIRVEFLNNEEVKIDIPLIIKYGFNIPDIANRVQENVRINIEKMTNLSVKDIDVSVQAIERG